MEAQMIQIKDGDILQYPITKPECVVDENGNDALFLIEQSGKSRGVEVEYNTECYDIIISAWNEGKRVNCLYNNKTYSLNKVENNCAYFSCIYGNENYYVDTIVCDSENKWINKSDTIETISNKIENISAGSTHSQYPTAKAVYQAIENVQAGGGTAGVDNTIQKIIAGSSPNFIWEDVQGKIHYDTGSVISRNGEKEEFKTMCKKIIALSLSTSGKELSFLFGTQDDKATIEEVYPYVFLPQNITSLNFTFSGMSKIKDWSFLSFIDVTNITSMSGVFYKSTADIIDVSSWNVSNVTLFSTTGAYGFFGEIKNVVGLDKWNVGNGTAFPAMFASSKIKDFNSIKNWNVKKATNLKNCFVNISEATELDLSQWELSDNVLLNNFIRGDNLITLGLPNIPTGADTTSILYTKNLQTLYMREDAKIYTTLNITNAKKLSFDSIKTILSHLADTPDEGATITFDSGLYSKYSEEEKAEIDTLRDSAVSKGWVIVNMGGE